MEQSTDHDRAFARDAAFALEGLNETLGAFLDDELIAREWLAFTDDISLPDAADPFAESAFKAGFATAIRRISELAWSSVERYRSEAGR